MLLPARKTHALSHHRVSQPGSTYFLTLTTKYRKTGLSAPVIAESIKDALRLLHREKNFTFLCGTIMPEHIHILVILGNKLTLSQTIAKLKVVTKSSLQKADLTWHRNYHDHRLRQKTNTDSFARYIFLNPYRRKLLSLTETWPHWLLSKDYHPDFLDQLEASQLPPSKWLESLPPLLDIMQSDSP